MKKTTLLFVLFFSLTAIQVINGQYGRYGRYGRQQRTGIPQAQTPPEEPEPKTADELVDEQMPKITETLELDPFEEAIVRATLAKYVQKRMELQILKLEPKKMKEEFDKLSELQNEELKAGLPEEKYLAYLDLQNNRFKAKKKKKKKRKTKIR